MTTRMLSVRLAFLGLALAPYAFSYLDQNGVASYSKNVAPLLKAHCASCHSGAGAAANLDLDLSGRIMGMELLWTPQGD